VSAPLEVRVLSLRPVLCEERLSENSQCVQKPHHFVLDQDT
jgi:hypothetical protein